MAPIAAMNAVVYYMYAFIMLKHDFQRCAILCEFFSRFQINFNVISNIYTHALLILLSRSERDHMHG